MFASSRLGRIWLAPAALAFALLAGGCSDSTDPGDGPDHADAAGLLAEIGGVEVVSVNADRVVTGGFTVAAGEETDHVEIRFLDEDGEVIDIDESEFYLAAEVDDEGVAEVEQHAPGEFEVHVVGVAEGVTSIRFLLMHGRHPDGHSDYTSPDIPVTVTGPAN